jgi:starch synthase
LKALLVHDAYLKYAVGQVEGLRQAGVQVMTLCRTHPFQSGAEAAERVGLIAAMRDSTANVIEIPGLLRDPSSIPAVLRARRTIARWQPDVIHVHDAPDPRSLLIAPRRPTVLTIHDPVPHPGALQAPAPWTRAAFDRTEEIWRRRADVAIVHSDILKHELATVRRYPQVSVIAHGMDVESAPAPVPAAPLVVLFGKLQPYKGIEVLDAAMPLVWASRPDVRFVVAGRGDAVPQVQDPRFTLHHRYIEWEEVRDLLDRASLLVLPYTQASETGVGSLGVARGIPVVVSDVGALPELALTRDYVVPPRDPESLAAAILRHVDDGAGIRQLILDKIAKPRSWNAVGRQTAELYHEVLSRLG